MFPSDGPFPEFFQNPDHPPPHNKAWSVLESLIWKRRSASHPKISWCFEGAKRRNSIHRHLERQTEIQREREKERERERQRQTERERQTDRQTGRQTNRQTGRHLESRQTDRHVDTFVSLCFVDCPQRFVGL